MGTYVLRAIDDDVLPSFPIISIKRMLLLYIISRNLFVLYQRPKLYAVNT